MLWLFIASASSAMLIPEEVEMLEGFAPMTFPAVNPEDDYFEARAMSDYALYNAIRNRRDAHYEVLESDGLRSRFQPNSVSAFKEILRRAADDDASPGHRSRRRRSDAPEKKTSETSTDTKKGDSKTSIISNEKNVPLAAALVSKWTRTPFEYSKIQHNEDSLAVDSSPPANEGIKSRTPRVNFVTQQKKSLDNNDSKSSATKSDIRRSPPLIRENKDSSSPLPAPMNNNNYPDRHVARPSSPLPEYYHERRRDRYMNRYDK